MATNALEVRMARLEGAYEQIRAELQALRAELQALRTELIQRIDRIDQKFDQKFDATFRWGIGIILANWVTLMLAIFLRR
jgi:chromosome segregation ATPase